MSALSRIRLKSIVFAVLLLLAATWWLWPARSPHLTLTTLTGEKVILPSGQGPVLLSFWATTCPACLAEIPLLERLHRTYAPHGLRLVAVAMPYDPPNRVVEFVKGHNLTFAVALDPFGHISQAFGVTLVPTLILLAPDGQQIWHHTGVPDAVQLESLLQSQLTRGR